jgi:hypothetical protein
VSGVATSGGGFATFGVEALNGGGAGEYASAVVADDVDEQPGNGVGIWRRNVGDGFTGDAAAVVGLPGGPGEMFAEGLAIFVEELSVGRFQLPEKRCGPFFTGVDLVALGVELEEELFVGGRLKLGRDLLGGQREREKGRERGQAECGGDGVEKIWESHGACSWVEFGGGKNIAHVESGGKGKSSPQREQRAAEFAEKKHRGGVFVR